MLYLVIIGIGDIMKTKNESFTENPSNNLEKKTTISVTKRKRVKKKLKQSDIKKYSMNELDHVILKIKANERKYMMTFSSIILVVFVLVSYIVFSSVQERNKYNLLRNGGLLIEFKTKENGLGDIIDLVDVDTFSDSSDVFDTYDVTITNGSKDSKEFQIFIVDDEEMIDFDNCKDIFLDRKFLRYSINGGSQMELTDDSESILSGSLKAGESIKYSIKVWVSDTYKDNPHYHGKIVVKQVNKKKTS